MHSSRFSPVIFKSLFFSSIHHSPVNSILIKSCPNRYVLQSVKSPGFHQWANFSSGVSKFSKFDITFVNKNSKLLKQKNAYCTPFVSKRNFHPLVWMIAKPLMKFAAVLSGRGFRKWWKDLPPNKKKYFKDISRRNSTKIGATTAILTGLLWAYYESHIQETPITKRRRFLAFSPEQMQKMNDFEFELIMESLKGQFLPANHAATKQVQKIVSRILDANLDIDEVKQREWNVAVISSSLENAFVLPSGYIFVFTGMMKLCSNDDQLGTVLAHEIAHCILGHGVENVSFANMLDFAVILLIAIIWAVLPSDTISLLIHWLFQKMVAISFTLPYSRRVEIEADEVGLELAAKACFDVRESSAFWSKMAILHKVFGKGQEIEFLSTHPNHESRSEFLDGLMEKALQTRSVCGCPMLRTVDPRMNVETMSKVLETQRRKSLKENPESFVKFVPK